MDLDGKPTAGSLGDFGRFEAEEARDRRAREVNIEDADGVACEAEGKGKLRCY